MDENFDEKKQELEKSLRKVFYCEELKRSYESTFSLIELFNKETKNLDKNTVCYLDYKYLEDNKIYEGFSVTLTEKEEIEYRKEASMFDDIEIYRTTIKDAKIIFEKQLELLNNLIKKEKKEKEENLER